jgi:hypothetical protein
VSKLFTLSVICILSLAPPRSNGQQNAWIATWATSPQPSAPDPDEPLFNLENQTVRERARVSIGGD